MQCDCESIHCTRHRAGGCTFTPSVKISCWGLVANECNDCLAVTKATVPADKIDWVRPLVRIYSVYRHHRENSVNSETLVESGLDWNTAKTKAEQLSEAERKLHPLKTSWSRDLFIPHFEKME